MNRISIWLNMFRRSTASQFDALGQKLDAQYAMLQQLQRGQVKIMSAMDDLKTAVDGAVAEMEHAAQTIQNHSNPDIANDPQLADMANRLNNAVAALKGMDPADTAPATDTTAQPGA